ncbi:hypothetical protein TNCV_4395701 [Trichonephila clavipes]|uniref:Uncharacterized protein n=1 Tax=Trichonephila clavipes TaxID=2585209 RepID=A0A8X6W5H7_TRICX|nr:hypothetical protein TNCV_4395701 [Trichonephila clavipes]
MELRPVYPVVKVIPRSWHVMSSNLLPLMRGGRCTSEMSRLKCLPEGVVWKSHSRGLLLVHLACNQRRLGIAVSNNKTRGLEHFYS